MNQRIANGLGLIHTYVEFVCFPRILQSATYIGWRSGCARLRPLFGMGQGDTGAEFLPAAVQAEPQ